MSQRWPHRRLSINGEVYKRSVAVARDYRMQVPGLQAAWSSALMPGTNDSFYLSCIPGLSALLCGWPWAPEQPWPRSSRAANVKMKGYLMKWTVIEDRNQTYSGEMKWLSGLTNVWIEEAVLGTKNDCWCLLRHASLLLLLILNFTV